MSWRDSGLGHGGSHHRATCSEVGRRHLTITRGSVLSISRSLCGFLCFTLETYANSHVWSPPAARSSPSASRTSSTPGLSPHLQHSCEGLTMDQQLLRKQGRRHRFWLKGKAKPLTAWDDTRPPYANPQEHPRVRLPPSRTRPVLSASSGRVGLCSGWKPQWVQPHVAAGSPLQRAGGLC